ncbi:hypothetical protein JCM11251_001073 [Rhodosporidiobolus azoricus]
MRSALLFPLVAVLTVFAPSTTAQRNTRHSKRAVGSTVRSLTGTYQGKILSRVEQFLGVPFALPPVGDLRFRRPQPVPVLQPGDAQYGQIVDATAFHPRCIQTTSKATSEDCLYVNIYRNQGTSSTAKLPVMVYIYGGSGYSGGASSYSPSALVTRSQALSRPVIFVTLDYRLGALGFGASPALREAGALNFGLHDQRQALRWIKQNIEFFGGDPEKIMLFGTSYGAISVSYQMMAYGGNFTELIRGAILESGAPGTAFAFDHTSSFPAYTFLSEEEKNNRVLAKTGCTGAVDELSCLRQATVSQILAGQSSVRAAGGFPYAPVIDGEFLPDVPSKLLAAGKFAQIPMIVGSQLDEGPEFVASKAFTSLNMTLDSQMVDWLMAQTPGMTKGRATSFLSMYPDQQQYGSPFNTGSESFLWGKFKRASAIFGDLAFEAPRRAFLAAANAVDDRNKAAFLEGSLATTTTIIINEVTSTEIPVTVTSTIDTVQTSTSSSDAVKTTTTSPDGGVTSASPSSTTSSSSSAAAAAPTQTCSCRTGFTLSGDACVNPTASTSSRNSPSTTPATTSFTTPSTTVSMTTSAAATLQTCTASAECLNEVPKNANRYCAKGVCSFRCRAGFTLSSDSTCLDTSSRRRRRALTSMEDASGLGDVISTVVTYEGVFVGNVSTTVVQTVPAVYTPLPVYSYQFSQRTGDVDYLGAGHGDEIPWVFANGAVSNDDQLALRDAMSGYWIYFANDLDPNGPSSPIYWPQYLQSNWTQIQFKFGQQALIAAISYINQHPEIFGQ